jgi:hypothetical protein
MRQRYQRTSGAVIIEHTADEENALNNELALKALMKKFSTLCTLLGIEEEDLVNLPLDVLKGMYKR